MTVTYSTDLQVQQRSTIAGSALDALNAALTARSLAVTTMDAQRVLAKAQLLVDLHALKGITEDQITRPTDLLEAEIALVTCRLCEAVRQRVAPRGQPQTDIYAQEADTWRARYESELARCRPIDGIKSAAASFEWGRG